MQLSARNQLRGTVEAVERGAVTATVRVRLDEGPVVTSSITLEAATELALEVGDAVTAIVKSSDVIIGVDR